MARRVDACESLAMFFSGKTEKYLNHSILLNDYSLLLNMIPKNTGKIIMFLLRHIQTAGYNINQLANLLNISVGSAFKILKDLEKQGMVSATNLSNASYYKLNFLNPQTRNICEFLLAEQRRSLKGYSKIYSEELKTFEKAELIVLFGSILKEKEFNDVDVLFITSNPKEANKFSLDVSKVRAKPVVPLIMTKKDLIMELKAKQEAIQDIIEKGVVLKGDSVFVEVIQNAQQ